METLIQSNVCVTHIENHTIINRGSVKFVLVADARLVIVKDKPTKTHHPVLLLHGKGCKPYFISPTEKIENSDYVYDKLTNVVDKKHFAFSNNNTLSEFKLLNGERRFYKVLVYPQNFSSITLDAILSEKIQAGSLTKVECVKLYQNKTMKNPVLVLLPSQWDDSLENWHEVKLNKKSEAIIYSLNTTKSSIRKKNKSYTKKEVIDLCYKYKDHILDTQRHGRSISESKWFKENL